MRNLRTADGTSRRPGAAGWLASFLRRLISLVRKERPCPPGAAAAGPVALIAAAPAEPPERPESASDPRAQTETALGLQAEVLDAEPELAAPQPEQIAPAGLETETPREAEGLEPSLNLLKPTPEAAGMPSAGVEISSSDIETTVPLQETESDGAAVPPGIPGAPAADVQADGLAKQPPLDAEAAIADPERSLVPAEAVPLLQPNAGGARGDAAAATRSGVAPGDVSEMAAPTALIAPGPDEDLRPAAEPMRLEASEPSIPDSPAPEVHDAAAAAPTDATGEAGLAVELEAQPGDLEDHAADEEPAAGASQDPAEVLRLPFPYRPNLRERTAAKAPRSPAARSGAPASQAAPGSLEADLVLAFQPGGWGIDLSLLLRRPADLPEQISVNVAGELLELDAIDDGLFEPIPIADPISALAQGVAAQSLRDAPRRWVRSGRRLHVFTERPGVFGFASAPRVVIGQENIILCETALAGQVLDLCQLAGSTPPQDVEGPGVPAGWRCLRGYHPRWPGPSDDEDIFLALSPLPDAAIELVGGIAVNRRAWISGRPPAIRILGSEPGPGDVTIDLAPASQESGGHWTSPGWDAPGHHAVRFAGLQRRYEIVEVDAGWDWWAAHAGPGFALAGAIASSGTGRPAIVVRDLDGWLLGARPGEAVRMSSAAAAGGAFGSPAFAPVWALPAKTKRRPAARLLDAPTPPQAPPAGAPLEAIRLWRQLIRDAASSPASGVEPSAQLWQAYREAARLLKRRGR